MLSFIVTFQRTVESFFCPHCGSRHRPSLRICPSPTCAKQLTLKVRCGNCQLPREDPFHLYCRYCGLSYADVGVVRPVRVHGDTTDGSQSGAAKSTAVSKTGDTMEES
ncbi:unnamed protein product [Orchesella dallaii]|uniref:DZANK-type domain-containing protein n=1 Tax=Orchesella dallaii TaxID=48710 RepID=A0ABP1R5Q6_9HEXA